MTRKTRVLVIDDSAVVRKELSRIIAQDPQLEVMGTAADPYFAAEKIKKEIPDVITLDVEMPRMDGITFLKTLMAQRPMPVVVISSLSAQGSATALQALETGAVEVLEKPRLGGTSEQVKQAEEWITERIKAAASAKVGRRSFQAKSPTPQPAKPASPKSAPAPPTPRKAMAQTTEKVVAIGASTGGTEALREILEQLPANGPGIVVVQHMPENFTRAYAQRLDGLSALRIKEAAEGDSILRGQALIAPGNRHLMVRRSGARYYVALSDEPPVNRHRPSVDVLFRSTAQYAGPNSMGILLTGMGSDGAQGLLQLRQAGAQTVAQDEASSIVFGMPKVAIELGAAQQVLGLSQMAQLLMKM